MNRLALAPIFDDMRVGKLEISSGEIEAGLVFAAAAAEHQFEDTATAFACLTDAESCYSSAASLLGSDAIAGEERDRLQSRLQQLRQALDLLSRGT